MPHLRRLARDTDTVDTSGDPLVFDIGSGGGRIGARVVDAIERLASDLPLDVDAVVHDIRGDEIDARRLVREVRPVSADPPDGVESVRDGQFVGVRPGTRLTFEAVVDPDAVDVSDGERRAEARVVFRGFRRSVLGSQRVELVIGGTDGCP